MLKVIVFDLWNTLAYNNRNELNPMLQLMKRVGFKSDSYKKLENAFMRKRFPSVIEAVKSVCRELGIEASNELVRDLLDIWDLSKFHFEFFPDVIPVLKKLREKYRIGLISNTDCFSVRDFFLRGYKKYFDAVVFSYEAGLIKPDSKIFRLVLKNMDAEPEEAVMVGDNLKDDVLAAKKLGMKAVLIKRNPKEFNFSPSWIEKGSYPDTIHSLKELERFL